ncbi:MAG: copper resistance CopC family protein [Microbacterium sp.]
MRSHTAPVRPAMRAALLLSAAVLAAAAMILPASPAHAHDELIGSDPASGATLDASPAQLTLTFSAEIADDPGATEVQVTDAAGTALAGAPSAQDNVLTVPLEGEASGAVTVLWKVVSSDGHPISGEFAFTVTPAVTPTETPTATPTPEPTPSEEPSETATPSAPPATEDSSTSDAWPWIIGGVLLVAVAGAVVYLLVSRARREKALAEEREKALGAGSAPASSGTPGEGAQNGSPSGSEPPADR